MQLNDSATGNTGLIAILEERTNPVTGQKYYIFKGYRVPDQFNILGDRWVYDPLSDYVGMQDGSFSQYIDTLWQSQTIDNQGHQTYFEVKDSSGNVLFYVEPNQSGSYNRFDSWGEYVDGVVDLTNNKYQIKNRYFYKAIYDSNNLSFHGDLSWASQYGLTPDDFDNVQIERTENSDGTIKAELTYINRTSWEPDTIGSLWANNPEFRERIENYAHRRGYRTFREINLNTINVVDQLRQNGEAGDVVLINGAYMSGDTWSGVQNTVIKIATNGPVNHVGFLYIDNNGEKWIMEMLADKQGLHKTSLEEFRNRNVIENNDIQVGRVNGIDSAKMNKIVQNLLLIKSGNQEVPKDITYNYWNLFAMNGEDNDSFMCGGLVEYIYRMYDPDGSKGVRLFDGNQHQYSPVDIYNSIKEKGEFVY